MVPFDDKSPFVTSGIRVGTAAMTTRGMKEKDMTQIVEIIDKVLMNRNDKSLIKTLKNEVHALAEKFPLY